MYKEEKSQNTEKKPKETYKKNKDYDQNKFNHAFDMWKIARQIGNQKLAAKMMNTMYDFCEKFVYKELWKKYPSLMNNFEHRQNLIQEVWVKIVEQLPNYDYDKAGITTFIALWIPHVGTSYYSDSFTYTTNYFTDAMTKVNAAENMLRVNNIDISIDSLMRITNLPEVTIIQAQELLRRKERVSYEAMAVEQPSNLLGPEATILQNEATENFNRILQKELDEEELLVVQFLTSPKDSIKDVASYGEVVENMNTYMKEINCPDRYNVPKVKKIVSHISMKIVNSKEMNNYLPNAIKAYKSIGLEGDMPVLDDEDFIKEQESVLYSLL